MPVFRIDKKELSFPHPTLAREDGLLAVGGDLCVKRLLLAYTNGIFLGITQGKKFCGGVLKSALLSFPVKFTFPIL